MYLTSIRPFGFLFINAENKVVNTKRKHTADNNTPPEKLLKVEKGPTEQVPFKQVVVTKSKSSKYRTSSAYPKSYGCARTSINGWEWHKWSITATPSERTRVRGSTLRHAQSRGSEINVSQLSNSKGLSARTNRVKMRNLLAAADGADLLKATQLKVGQILLWFYVTCWYSMYLNLPFHCRHGRNVYVSNRARYMIGVWLHWSQLMQKILLLNMLEN